jgi:hypothetical protein
MLNEGKRLYGLLVVLPHCVLVVLPFRQLHK